MSKCWYFNLTSGKGNPDIHLISSSIEKLYLEGRIYETYN